MNKTSIEWCDYTWNPVTGCFHPCRNTYCYNTQKKTSPLNRFGARFLNDHGQFSLQKNWKERQTGECHIAKKGEIYPFGYDPTFYPHRLEEPCKVKTPSRIFVVDTGDLFGWWVPAQWIDSVMNIVYKCQYHTFMFLTKNPSRAKNYTFPDNAWVGTSVNSNQDEERAEIIKTIDAPVRFLSIEPLLGNITFPLKGIQWVIIGAMTGTKAILPKPEWIKNIVKQASILKIPVFLKNNLRTVWPDIYQCYPEPTNLACSACQQTGRQTGRQTG